MKSQRRHELQHNTLEAELTTTVVFFREHWKKMLMGTITLITIVLAIITYVSKRSDEAVRIESNYAQIKATINRSGGTGTDAMLGELTSLATQTRVPSVAASAHVDIGDIHAMATVGGDADRLAQAKSQYNLVIDDFPKQYVPVAKAHMGLAKLAESADEARKHYEAIKTMADEPKSTVRDLPIVAMAEADAKELKKHEQNVRMATTVPTVAASQASELDNVSTAPAAP